MGRYFSLMPLSAVWSAVASTALSSNNSEQEKACSVVGYCEMQRLICGLSHCLGYCQLLRISCYRTVYWKVLVYMGQSRQI